MAKLIDFTLGTHPINSMLSHYDARLIKQRELDRRWRSLGRLIRMQGLTVRRGSSEANRLKSGAGNYRFTPLAKIQF